MTDVQHGWLCGMCGAQRATGADCHQCGSTLAAQLRCGRVIAFPAGAMGCARCGRIDRPLEFRAWSWLAGAIWPMHEGRYAEYVCRPCGQVRSSQALLYSAALGWWAVPAWLGRGWRTLETNLRSLVGPPTDPRPWRATPAADFANGLPHLAAAAGTAQATALLDRPPADSPLHQLDERQRRAVLAASGLYERVGVSPRIDGPGLRAAYYERCKALHPDVDPNGAEAMIALNQAWEILGDPAMRTAYDWVRERRASA